MANIFVSHAWADLELARTIQGRMSDKGHRSRIPVGAAVAGNWRAKYAQALGGADVLIVLVTEASLASRNVLGEIGAARVLEHVRGTIMLPVLVGDIAIPEFISDIYCFRLRDPARLELLVEELDKAIDDNIKLIPRIFISHRHKDEIVAALTALLSRPSRREERYPLHVGAGYMLTPGRGRQVVADRDRGPELVIGVLSRTRRVELCVVRVGCLLGTGRRDVSVLARGAICRHAIAVERRRSMSLELEELSAARGLRRQQDIAEAADGAIGKSRYRRALAAAAGLNGTSAFIATRVRYHRNEV